MQTDCQEVLDTLGRDHRDDPIVKVALELERIALSDDYFVENNLSPNIDFYSAITLQGARLTTEIFTVLYAIRVFDAQQHVVRVERRVLDAQQHVVRVERRRA